MEETKKPVYKKWWFWVGIVVIIVTISLTFIILNQNKPVETNINYTSTVNKKDNSTKENIVIEKIGVVHKDTMLIKIKNNNKNKVMIDNIYAILKDENGNFLKKIDCFESNIPINGEKETVSYLWNDDDTDNFENYSNIEFGFDINDSQNGAYPANLYICDNFEINANDTGKQIAVTIQNNNNETVLVSINVVFYQNNKIIGFSNETTNQIKPNEKGYVNLAYPYNENNGKDLQFDEYRVNLVKAKIQ